jgi:hypothetical protein
METYKPVVVKGDKDKKPKKDPNAPKRAMTSFLQFSNEQRPKIKTEHPSMTFGELGKKIGEMFRALSAEEKEKYEKLAKIDKERYKKQMSEYKEASSKAQAKGGDDSDGLDDAGDDDDDDDDDDDSDDED